MSSARSYLVLYNAVQAVGWATALYQIISASRGRSGIAGYYEQSNAVVSRRAGAETWQKNWVISSSLLARVQGYSSWHPHWKSCMQQQVGTAEQSGWP